MRGICISKKAELGHLVIVYSVWQQLSIDNKIPTAIKSSNDINTFINAFNDFLLNKTYNITLLTNTFMIRIFNLIVSHLKYDIIVD